MPSFIRFDMVNLAWDVKKHHAAAASCGCLQPDF